MLNNSKQSNAKIVNMRHEYDPFLICTLESGVKFVMFDGEMAENDYYELLNNIQNYIHSNDCNTLYFFGTEWAYGKYKEKNPYTESVYVNITKVL